MRANGTQVLRKFLGKKSHPAAVGYCFHPLTSVTIHLFLKDLFIFTVCVWAFVSMYVCPPPMCLASTGAKRTSDQQKLKLRLWATTWALGTQSGSSAGAEVQLMVKASLQPHHYVSFSHFFSLCLKLSFSKGNKLGIELIICKNKQTKIIS